MTKRSVSFAAVLLCMASLARAADDPAAVRQLVDSLGLEESPVALRDTPGWQRPRRIVVRAESPQRLAAYQEVAPGVELVAAKDETEAAALVPGADAVLGFCEPPILAAGTKLRWIQLFSAGAGPCIGMPEIRERGILVTNMQRVSGPEIAEHALAMLLAFTRGLNVYLPWQASGKWLKGAVPLQGQWELGGRTLLIVGLGGIGTQLAERAHALGMRVIATRASLAPKPAFVDYVGTPAELLKLAAEADVVVNCVPLLPSTTDLFDAKYFAAQKPGSYFINVGRGQSVVTDALVAALKEGRLAGAGLDVMDPEPLPPDHPLWKMPNVIITPHVAATSDRIFQRIAIVARENLRRYVAGDRMLSVVDQERGY